MCCSLEQGLDRFYGWYCLRCPANQFVSGFLQCFGFFSVSFLRYFVVVARIVKLDHGSYLKARRADYEVRTFLADSIFCCLRTFAFFDSNKLVQADLGKHDVIRQSLPESVVGHLLNLSQWFFFVVLGSVASLFFLHPRNSGGNHDKYNEQQGEGFHVFPLLMIGSPIIAQIGYGECM